MIELIDFLIPCDSLDNKPQTNSYITSETSTAKKVEIFLSNHSGETTLTLVFHIIRMFSSSKNQIVQSQNMS